MEKKVTPRYDSFTCVIPLDLQEDFIAECKLEGLDAGKIMCFSTKRFDEVLRVIYDRWEEYAPKLLKVLSMFKNKHKIKIEVWADRKLIDLEGLSVDEAIKVISAVNEIKVSHQSSENEQLKP
ncbi:hypothetical protein AL518_20055 [Hafnia paralvei]|uniref:hypothetical protein n=1 Tax=Hafnia paralvei TaxID=546367 RepID=UPI00076AFF5D|nr:hypothetical protein [Hafnia paralvei]AMH20086.1 hypothetical protein AL518_20055 [Hafnia paralvei]